MGDMTFDRLQFRGPEWFAENKAVYEQEKKGFDAWTTELITEFADFENMDGVLLKHCSYRIYRDVRFSKNKAPYKTWFSASFSEGGRKSGLMDYYVHIEPNGASFLGGGMYSPTPEINPPPPIATKIASIGSGCCCKIS